MIVGAQSSIYLPRPIPSEAEVQFDPLVVNPETPKTAAKDGVRIRINARDDFRIHTAQVATAFQSRSTTRMIQIKPQGAKIGGLLFQCFEDALRLI